MFGRWAALLWRATLPLVLPVAPTSAMEANDDVAQIGHPGDLVGGGLGALAL